MASRPSDVLLPAGWEELYLDHLRRLGGRIKGAAVAGVPWKVIREREERDPAFAEAVHTALEEYLDSLEHKLVEQAEKRGNPVGFIVRLKAGRPAQYIERSASIALNIDVPAPALTEVREILRRMLRAASPETLAQLTDGTVLDVQALPAKPEDSDG